jgi:5-methylcytosine-specific restriction endonuclease McrA
VEKRCKDCGQVFPETREFFGQFKNVRAGQAVIGFRNTCRECMRARASAHNKAHPEQRRERMSRRIERQGATDGSFDESDVQVIRSALNDLCRYCDAALNGGGEVDHLTPIARGGTSARSNLTLACMPCNRAKLGKTLEEFITWRAERGLDTSEQKPTYERPDRPTNSIQRRSFR